MFARSQWLILIGCLALLVGACGGAGSEETTTPPPAATTTTPTTTFPPPEPAPWPTNGWPVSTPEEQGMDSARLADMVERIVAFPGVDSVIVVRNGYVVLDAVVHPFPADTGHIIHSCTKSIMATLIGIAIDQGLLAGVDVPVVEILADDAPETVDARKASMTVEDLLTMSTGLRCRDSYLYEWQGMREMQASEDWAAHVLALPMAEEPGARFEYCNGSSFLLSAVLSEVTGMSAAEYAADVLFEPLGFGDVFWPASPGGITMGWGELVIEPADMAKFGYLFLHDGEWDGNQLVPRAWVEAATSGHVSAGTLSDSYGYQWWIDDSGYVMAQGFGGQYVIVVPEHDLVVAITSGLPGDRFHMPEELTTEYVIPAVVSDRPLAPDADGEARLADAVAQARSGPEPEVAEIPDTVAFVDGARYEFRPNEFGNTWFVLRFEAGSAHLGIEDDEGPQELEIGMDGRFVTDEGLPVALRGQWRADDTFVVEYQVVGMVERGTLRFEFEGDVARVTHLETATGSVERSVADRVG